MLNLRQVYRPTTIDEALQLLRQPGAVALAGGTELIADRRRDVETVVDLGGLGLSYIRERQGMVALGATTPLANLAESPILGALANGILAQAAHRSAASVRRNQSTLAGTLIAEPDGILAVALLALDAQVTVIRKETRLVPLVDFLSMRDHLLMSALLTEVTLPLANPRGALETVARTPRDKPIVSVCAVAQIVRSEANEPVAENVRIALGGVGKTAVRAVEAEKELEGKQLNKEQIERAARKAGEGLTPVGDYRGSAEYRKEMAIVLTRRAVKELAKV